jgi:thiamine biosynthesis lipoprotein
VDVAARRHHVEVMGTVFSFAFAEPVDLHVLAEADEELRRLNRLFSPWRDDSEVSRLSRGQITLRECAPEVTEVLGLCAEAETWTRGFFSARFRGGLDPTGLVKGWAVARLSRLLANAGSAAHAVNGGGDVLTVGPPEHQWRIGVADPLRPGRLLATMTASTLAVATSGNAERPGEILDPFTGRPALDLLAVTVVCADVVRADAAATAAVAMGRRCSGWLEAATGVEALVVAADGARWMTSGFADLISHPSGTGQRSPSSADCSDWR